MMQSEELLKLLLEKNILTKEKHDILLARVNEGEMDIVGAMTGENIVEEEKITQVQATYYSLPYVVLHGVKIEPEAVNIFSKEVAENYNIICFENKGGKIKVGIIDPGNFKAIEAIDFLAKGSGLKVEYYLMSKGSFSSAYKNYKTISREIDTALKTREDTQKEKEDERKEKDKDSGDIKDITKSAPVVKIVSVIIRHAVDGGASDIHVEPMEKESRVRYRIDGILHTSLVLPRNVHNSIVARIKVMANLKLDETRIPQDGRIRMAINEQNVDFRVSILPLVGAEKVVMRILYTNKGVPKLEELGYIGEQLKIINACTEQTEGIILVTGPTGSGKSTSLFALLGLLNKEGVNISTLEDPVEYQMKGVSQSQIKPSIGYTFASGLRSFLRQDPDIIMVGEIRDEETGELSIHAALTGHLVLSTIHTTSALGAIARLIDMNVELFLLGSTLNTIVAQRLVRKICENCKKTIDVSDESYKSIKKVLSDIPDAYLKEVIKDFDWDNLRYYKGEGCPKCANTGYAGRVCIAEVIDVNDVLKRKILDGKMLRVEDVKEQQIFTSMKQDGYMKVLLGYTTMEEVLRVMRD